MREIKTPCIQEMWNKKCVLDVFKTDVNMHRYAFVVMLFTRSDYMRVIKISAGEPYCHGIWSMTRRNISMESIITQMDDKFSYVLWYSCGVDVLDEFEVAQFECLREWVISQTGRVLLVHRTCRNMSQVMNLRERLLELNGQVMVICGCTVSKRKQTLKSKQVDPTNKNIAGCHTIYMSTKEV